MKPLIEISLIFVLVVAIIASIIIIWGNFAIDASKSGIPLSILGVTIMLGVVAMILHRIGNALEKLIKLSEKK